MKHAKRFSAVFGILGTVLLLTAVLLSLLSLNAPARLISGGEKAEERTRELMDAICEQDYESASSLLLGAPALGTDSTAQSTLGNLFWEAYSGSLSYAFSGDCYTGESGLCRDVTITALDIPAVLEKLQERLPELLSKYVAETDPSEVYNEDGSYRDDFVMGILGAEAEEILEEEASYSSQTITLHLTCQNGQWLIHPETALINIIAGNLDA